MARMRNLAEMCAFAALIIVAADAAPAQPYAARPVQGSAISDGPDDDGREDGMAEDDERGRAPDRDDPSEDGTAGQAPDEEPAPGCIFRERSLELLV